MASNPYGTTTGLPRFVNKHEQVALALTLRKITIVERRRDKHAAALGQAEGELAKLHATAENLRATLKGTAHAS